MVLLREQGERPPTTNPKSDLMTTTTVVVAVPKNLHGKVIGTKGATKMDIESDYQVTLSFPAREDETNCNIVISGPNNNAVELAKARILDICGQGGSNAANEQAFARVEQLRKEKDALFKKAHETARGPERERLMNEANKKKADFLSTQAQVGDTMYEVHNRGYALDQMDLHGLTVAQATAKVEERLARVDADLRSGRLPVLTIIVGIGNHSGSAGPKIKPTILALLKERGYVYSMDPAGGQIHITSVRGAAVPAVEEKSGFSQFLGTVFDFLTWCLGGRRGDAAG
jgi:DNA-nicking Smr family endonuclease